MRLNITADAATFDFETDVASITTLDLNDLYSSSTSDSYHNAIYFALLNHYFLTKSSGNKTENAHICYLIAYYVFTLLTPSFSEEISLAFIEEAIKEANDCEDYYEMLELIKKGN